MRCRPFNSSLSLAIIASFAIAACDRNNTPDVVDVASNIRTVGADNTVVWDQLFDEENREYVDRDGVGYAIKSGVDENGTAVTFVGLVGADQIDPPTGGGTAVYTGRSYAVSVSQPSALATVLTAGLASGGYSRNLHSAGVTIQANLDDGTFMGENGASSNGSKFTHRFNGSFTNGRITGRGFVNVGTVTSLDTFLEGRIGDEKAAIVFRTNSNSRTEVSGGMNLTRR